MTQRQGIRHNKHEWGVIFQCKNPYREFEYCPLCRQYKENSLGIRGLMTLPFFIALAITLKDINPMYHADSNDLFNVSEYYKGENMEAKMKFCDLYETLEEAQAACQCQCPPDSKRGSSYTYYRCNYGNCCGYHCQECGKFEVVKDAK